MFKLNAKQLRKYKAGDLDKINPPSPLGGVYLEQFGSAHCKLRREARGFGGARKNPIYLILDNVLDTYNIGSIFRLADAVAVKKVILCGETQIPPNSRIKKASINTTEWVEWEYAMTAAVAISKLKSHNSKLKVVAIEQSKKSIPYTKMKAEFPVALVVGNETRGVSKEVLKMADEIVELPIFGVNISLNVMVSLGIVLYKLLECLP